MNHLFANDMNRTHGTKTFVPGLTVVAISAKWGQTAEPTVPLANR